MQLVPAGLVIESAVRCSLFVLRFERVISVTLIVAAVVVVLVAYASLKDFRALDGSAYREADAVNNSDFALCKLGCGSPGFTELKLVPFKRGQTVYGAIINQAESETASMASVSSPVSNVALLCADSAENNGSVFWRVGLDVRNASDDGLLAHWVEAVRRVDNDVSTDAIVFSTWSYSSYVDFFGAVDVTNASIQFRVSTFNGSGVMGRLMSSQWYTDKQLAGGNYIQMAIAEEMWKDELAAVRVSFKSSKISSCSLVLSYNSHMGVEQRMEFMMDRSRGFLLDGLAFDHAYTLRLWHIGAVTTAYTSHEFRTTQCLKLVNDPALCAPPPVSDISWIWNSSENEGSRIVLSWNYGAPSKMVEDGSRVERRDSMIPVATAFPRMVHFDIAINPLVTASQYQCQFLDGQRRVVTWTHRSVVLYVPNEHCNYGIEITVVDSRNRRSTTTKAQVIRFEEKYQMLLSADTWNTGVIVLSLIVLASFVTVSGGLVACRVRDRREWNTIKRSISPPSPGPTITRTTSASAVGVTNKYVVNERCPMRTLNMVRLSFSDDTEAPVNSTPILKANSTAETSDGDDVSKVNAATPTTDDAEYDTIGTPRLTHNVFLHEQGCVHSHVTAENVYLAQDYNDPLDIPCDQSVKLGDFCWATVPRVKCGRVHCPQSLLPPEVAIEDENLSAATDVWQYGLLMASMVTLNSAQSLICLPPDVLLTDRIIKNYYTCLSSGIRQV
ncbi:unnamed protein product [Heligmosomoides polygyrus]|uniref:Protein kinase domain-containing protein n=1 Tax=Heligmosomoides polygyrus TaxID=6339 RepID=A0A3P7WWL6_HELPZ|nr:unnamed protein product [Heligmosomoides polygyrus]